MFNTEASLDDIYMYNQTFAVNQPLVTHGHLLKPDGICCPKCKQKGTLEGNGMRQGTRDVLGMEGCHKVFSYGMTCKGCREHGHKDFTFSTWDRGFLRTNFLDVIFDMLPWVYLDENTCICRKLLLHILQSRSQGVAVEQICRSRNEAVAARLLQPVQAYMTYTVERVQQQKQWEKLQRREEQQQQQEKEQQQQGEVQTQIPGRQPPKQAPQQSRQKQNSCQSTPKPAAAKQVGIRNFLNPSRVKAKAAAVGAAVAEAAGWAGAAAVGAAGAAAAGAGALASNLSPGRFRPLRADGAGGLAVANEQSPETSPTAPGAAAAQEVPRMANLAAGGAKSVATAAAVAKVPTPATAAAGGVGSSTEAPAPVNEDAATSTTGPLPRGPWDPLGFAYRKLDNKIAMKAFTQGGDDQRDLYRQLMDQEPAGGSLSLDHVHDVAKRMKSKHIGMLIACGGSGLVLGFWNVYSTSLMDVKQQLQDLDARQKELYGTGIEVVTVDNPHTTAALLRDLLPGIDVNMDIGHVLFSRLSKSFDKSHESYTQANRDWPWPCLSSTLRI